MGDVKMTEEEIFEWVKIKEEIGSTDEILNVETGTQKLIRKAKENPFVPLGALATVGCLSFGIYSFRRGEKRMSQLMMRARVLAQGFTVLAFVIGGLSFTAKDKAVPNRIDADKKSN